MHLEFQIAEDGSLGKRCTMHWDAMQLELKLLFNVAGEVGMQSYALLMW